MDNEVDIKADERGAIEDYLFDKYGYILSRKVTRIMDEGKEYLHLDDDIEQPFYINKKKLYQNYMNNDEENTSSDKKKN